MDLRSGRAQMRAIFRALAFVRPYWHIYILIILMSIISATLAAIPLLLISKIDRFLPVDQRNPLTLAVYIFGPLFGVGLLNQAIFTTLNAFCTWFLGQKVALHLRTRVFRHLQRLSLKFHQERPVGELIYRANTDIDSSLPLILTEIPQLISNTYSSIFYIFLIVTTGSSLLVGYLACFIPFYIGAHLLYTAIRHFDFAWRFRSQRLTAVLRESVAGARVVKAFNKSRFERLKYFHHLADFYRANQKRFLTRLVAMCVQQTALRWGYPFIYTILAIFVLLSKIDAIQYVGLIGYCHLLVYFVEVLYQKVQSVRVTVVPMQRLLETLDIQTFITEKPNAHALKDLKGRVEFDNVSFSYVPGTPVLKNASFTLEPGMKVGIVGPSGAGKSTLAQLLLRAYDPDSGIVRVDGHDLRDIRMNSLLKSMGVVLQFTDLFGGTIGDNIRYGRPKATDAEIVAAAKAAGLHNDVMNMPHQYETEVGEGEKLSGGQRQRVAIARALIKKPPMLLLDEPTASLDPRTAATIGETLKAICANTSTLIISHRLTDVEDADLILVMRDGEIVERGNHEGLLRQNGLYASLTRQSAAAELSKEGDIA